METVLSSVTAGVIGLDAHGRVELINAAGARMLALEPADLRGKPLTAAAPIFSDLVERAKAAPDRSAAGQARVSLRGQDREFVAQLTPKSASDTSEGWVVTFDDTTELSSAQRMAAWGDVARRIAHEIKNPLTPIQLSAERLRRKFGSRLDEDEQGAFNQYAEVIVRQAGDIRRMVDEFSKFARMPAPEARAEDLVEVVRDAVLLERSARPEIEFDLALPDHPLVFHGDRGMISQSLTNLLQNAAHAIEDRRAAEPDAPARIDVRLSSHDDVVDLEVADTGVGLPKHGRSRLLEPYVTTRARGSGLGLPIVRKIVEQHNGTIELMDRKDGARGAFVQMRFAVTDAPKQAAE
jgi:two-component system nitrogen regulation sensor histidine kinase NtrY